MNENEIYCETAGVRLHGWEGPQAGPPLVLLHGATGNWTAWQGLLPRLTQRWHVYAFDLRGHGLSGRPANLEGYNLAHHIADTVALLRDVVREPAVLLGHSYGAVISALSAQPAAAWLRGIILEDPPMMLRRDNEESGPFLTHFGNMLKIRQMTDNVDEIAALMAANMPGAPAEAMRPYAQSIAWVDPNYLSAIIGGNHRETATGVDFDAHLRGISCPTLLMQADPAKGAALAAVDLEHFLACAPHTRLVQFPGASHGIHDDQPEQFLQAVEAFAQSLP